MEGFISRLQEEKKELNDKLGKLTAFVNSDGFINVKEEQQVLLRLQLSAMELYYGILEQRLKLLLKE